VGRHQVAARGRSGGYAGNPSLLPLITESPADDLLLVQINPTLREGTPTAAQEIMDRVNEVTFNASLLKELRSIGLLKQLIRDEGRPGHHYREPTFLRMSAEVRRILVRDGRAAGVVVEQGGERREESARWVISAAGVPSTVACLDDGVAAAWQETLLALTPGHAYVALFIGLEGDIAAAGASTANRWVMESEDIGRAWADPAEEDAPGFFVSFSSLKDPAWSGPPSAEVLAVLEHGVFARFLAEPEGARSEEYLAYKDWVAERLLAQWQRHFPALAPMVRFHELATPLTQRRYVRTPQGSMYGIELSGERLATPALRIHTPLPGLLLAGQDIFGPGVPAAFMSGLLYVGAHRRRHRPRSGALRAARHRRGHAGGRGGGDPGDRHLRRPRRRGGADPRRAAGSQGAHGRLRQQARHLGRRADRLATETAGDGPRQHHRRGSAGAGGRARARGAAGAGKDGVLRAQGVPAPRPRRASGRCCWPRRWSTPTWRCRPGGHQRASC
jgi:hypothetical protein